MDIFYHAEIEMSIFWHKKSPPESLPTGGYLHDVSFYALRCGGLRANTATAANTSNPDAP